MRSADRWKGTLAALGACLAATAVCLPMYGRFDTANLSMVYLLGVAAVASRFGRGAAALAAVLSVLSFDILFVPPRWTLAVSETQYLVTFFVMLSVGLLISTLSERLRSEARESSEREHKTRSLYRMSRDLAGLQGKQHLVEASAAGLAQIFEADVSVLLLDGALRVAVASKSAFEEDELERTAAEWCFDHRKLAGQGTEAFPHARALYLPLSSGSGAVGVVGLLSRHSFPEPTRVSLATFASSLGLAVEREGLAEATQRARIQAETERLRNALLSSISHDLRTPLAAIAGAASTLKSGAGDQRELADTIYEEAVRLNMQVQNLLDMTRLQSGEMPLRKDWHSLEELVGSALQRTGELLHDREVQVKLPPDLPLVQVDGELLEKLLVNLIENVAAHTPDGSKLDIQAREGTEFVVLDVADHGAGIPKGEEARIFERFLRSPDTTPGKGFGLGLAICRAIARLHDGQIWAENRRHGTGAVFHVEIPKRPQPAVPVG